MTEFDAGKSWEEISEFRENLSFFKEEGSFFNSRTLSLIINF
jgi:hypothetical protein